MFAAQIARSCPKSSSSHCGSEWSLSQRLQQSLPSTAAAAELLPDEAVAVDSRATSVDVASHAAGGSAGGGAAGEDSWRYATRPELAIGVAVVLLK